MLTAPCSISARMILLATGCTRAAFHVIVCACQMQLEDE